MEMNFPFTNYVFNSFKAFLKGEFIRQYFFDNRQDFWSDDFGQFEEDSIEAYRDKIPDFENELLQVINVSNQEAIDTYFGYLKLIQDNLNSVSKSELTEIVNEYNESYYKDFEEGVIDKEKKYFANGDPYKYKHLEIKEAAPVYMSPVFGGSRFEKLRLKNYWYYCIDKVPELADTKHIDEYYEFIDLIRKEVLSVTAKYINQYEEGELKARLDKFFSKVIVYVEGEHDITYITKAADLSGRNDLLKKVELRQRNGYKNLDKIWSFYEHTSIEITPQKKILLYDCDTEKKNNNIGLFVYKRIIPMFEGHLITKGIENLFSSLSVQRAIAYKKEFIDFTSIRKMVRGKESYEETNEVNKDEKSNFCKWMCENGTKKDFENFEVIFDILDEIIAN